MKKVIIFIILAIIAIATLISCKKEATSAVPRAAVLLPGSVEFFSVQQKGMDRAAEEYGIKLLYADAEWDAGKQLAQVENFISMGVDIMLLCARDNQALLPAVDICREAGIELVTFTNTLGPNADGSYEGVATFVGTNEVTLGNLLGDMATRLLDDREANIVLIEGEPGTAPQRLRSEGFKQVVAQHPNWNIVYSQAIPGWTKEGALAAMEAFIQTGKKVDLVTCHWWAAASASAIALEESGYGDVPVIGLEFSKDLVQYIKEGKVDMTTNYSIENTGYTVVATAKKILDGQTVPPFIEIKPEIVDINNVTSITPEL